MPKPLGTARNVRLLVPGTVVPAVQQGQVQEEAAVERGFDDLLVIDYVAKGGRFGLHADRRSLYCHGRGGFAHLHDRIHAGAFVHAQRKEFCTKV